MDTKFNYTIVGLFVVLLGAVMIVLFFWISAMRHDKTYNTYLVLLDENVTGLTVQSPVRFNGVPVGYVDRIQLDPSNPQLVRLLLKIETGTPITTSTVAILQFQGITGVMYVGLKAKTTDAPMLEPKPGEKYPIIPAKPSLLVQLSEVLPQVTENMKKIGESVSRLLDEENQQAIKESLQSVSKFTKTLAENSKNLNDIMGSLSKTLKNTATASKNLPKAMTQLDETLKVVRATSVDFQSAAHSLRSTMKSSKFAVQSLSTQLLPTVQQTMTRLNTVSGNLLNLSSELNNNPSMLIRGKAPSSPGPGE